MDIELFQQMADIKKPLVVAYLNILNSSKLPGYDVGEFPEDHHGIPQSFYKLMGLEVDDSEDNIFKLNYPDHQKAHQILAIIAKGDKFKFKMKIADGLMNRKPVSEFMKGHITSEETRRKIGDANRGKVRTEEDKEKNRIAHLGKKSPKKGIPLSEEQKKKISESMKGRTTWNKGLTGFKLTEETKRKISETLKGKPKSEETKSRMSDAQKGHSVSDEARKKMSERKKGKPRSEEVRRKISEAMKLKRNTMRE